jgi:SNF2 family DNA or RNA helicase
LFMEMGTGKSKVLIDTIGILYGKGAINAVVIVAPKGVYRNWSTKEIPDHLPEHVDRHIAVWSPAPRKQEKADLVKLFHTDLDKLKIFIINVEAFSTPKGVKFTENFILGHQVLFAVDESTTIKNPKASRTKAITKLAKNTKYRRILTGSPITQSPLDLYSQTEVLETNLLGYTSYYSFQNHYGEVVNRYFGGRTVRQVVGYRNLDELSQKLDSFSYRVLKSDCLDLPEKLYIRRDVTLTAEQKKLYAELKELAITELANQETVSVTNVLTQLLRLHQIVCGHIKSDDGTETPINNNRIDELIEVIAEMQGKVIIWANYRQNILEIVETLQGLFGVDAVASYFGDTTPDERERIIKQFQNPDSPLRFFVGNTQTGGYGITLTEAQNVIYYSNNFDLEKRLQSEDRAHRIGQKNNVTYVDLVAKDTVDEKIVTALRNKLDLAQEVLGDDKWEDWLA